MGRLTWVPVSGVLVQAPEVLRPRVAGRFGIVLAMSCRIGRKARHVPTWLSFLASDVTVAAGVRIRESCRVRYPVPIPAFCAEVR